MDDIQQMMETYEKKIYSLISKCLKEDEKICFDKYFDFNLPEGAQALDWPKKTIIGIKYRLMGYAINRLIQNYDKVHPCKLIIIVIDAPDNYLESFLTHTLIQDKLPRRNIDLITYNDFLNLIESSSVSKDDIDKSIDDLYNAGHRHKIIQGAKDALKNNKISLFLGAGVSADAGVVTWDNLLQQLCIKRGLSKIDSDIESVVKGRYIIDEYKKNNKTIPDAFYNDMKSILYAKTRSSKLIKSIATLITSSNIESIISYNYDDLLEQEINNNFNKHCDSVYDKSSPNDSNNLLVYHVHGYIPEKGKWSSIVLGEREYHKIYQESYNWSNVEQLHALCRSTCFFIGLSMSDPNLRRLIDISLDGSDITPVHYAFLRRIEYNVPFMEKVMRSFGVNCIWYDNHKDLPGLLDSLI